MYYVLSQILSKLSAIYIRYRISLSADVAMTREYLIISSGSFPHKKACVRVSLEVLHAPRFAFLNRVRWVSIDEEILSYIISIEI